MKRLLAGLALAACLAPALGQGTLRIAMTAADVPLPNGQTDQGAEGMRFIGYTLFDSLVLWDLSAADKASTLVPGLAAEWRADAKDRTRWTFSLREGVRFHDGSAFNALAAVWNLDKLLNNAAPQYDPRQAAQGRARIPTIKSYRALDDRTLEVVTTEPDALLPFGLAWIVMSSPAQWEKVGKSWDAFLKAPAGTGPWKLDKYTPRERAELVPNKEYWNKARMPKADRLVLMPVPGRLGARLRRCARGRWTGSRRRRRMRCRACAPRASRSPPTCTRTSGPGTSAASRVRPGTTCACARPPTLRSTAPA